MQTQISTVADGLDRLIFLRHESQYAHVIRTDVTLVDLNLPRKSGLEL